MVAAAAVRQRGDGRGVDVCVHAGKTGSIDKTTRQPNTKPQEVKGQGVSVSALLAKAVAITLERVCALRPLERSKSVAPFGCGVSSIVPNSTAPCAIAISMIA